MRATVVVAELLVYVPAILFFLHRRLIGRGLRTRAVAVITVLLQPSLVLIDHGHFQYNAVMLGLAALTFALLYSSLPNPEIPSTSPPSVVSRAGDDGAVGGSAQATPRPRVRSLTRKISYQYILAAVSFSLALGFKQMSLYYAPAIFAVMLGRCWGLKQQIAFDKG